MTKDNFGIKGKVSWVLTGPDGKVKTAGEDHNTINQLHDALVADQMAGGSDTLILYGHAGTSAIAGDSSVSTNLATYCAELRTGITSKTQGVDGNDNDVIYVFTLGAGVCTATIEEIGLFVAQAQATGDMQAYSSAISVLKAAGDTLTITWTITYGAS
jgi:hypothetical protein